MSVIIYIKCSLCDLRCVICNKDRRHCTRVLHSGFWGRIEIDSNHFSVDDNRNFDRFNDEEHDGD